MERCLFVAETDGENAVSHVWFYSGGGNPRLVKRTDVTSQRISGAEFAGAPAEMIAAWLRRFANLP